MQRIFSLVSGLVFLLIFQVSEQIHAMVFSFLKTQGIPLYTPIKVTNTALLLYIFASIVLYCMLLVVLRFIQYDRIKKKIRNISYISGHILVCFPLGFLALKGINQVITKILINMPFTVWDISWLICDLSIYLFIYGPIAFSMEAMADSYLKKEQKNHSLQICFGTKEALNASPVLSSATFTACYRAMKTNLKELKPGSFFVITQYSPFKKPRHHWHYDNKGRLIFRD